MSQPDVRIQQIAPIRVLALRFIAQNHLHFARAWAEIRVAAREKAVPVSGYPIQIIYADEYREDNVDTEFALPVDDSWTESISLPTFGIMIVHELPGVEAATYPFPESHLDNFNAGLVDLRRWVAARGYQLSGPLRMVYRRGFVVPSPMEERVFEVQHPLKPSEK